MKESGDQRITDTFAGKRVLVTGGAGFIGSNLVRRLVRHGARRILVLDNLFTGRQENLADLQHETDLVVGGVEDFELVRRLVSDAKIVFHLAARNIVVSTSRPQDDFETNARGTFNVLEACRTVGVERVVYASSVSVYGNPTHLPLNEDDLLYPLNPYAASKLSGENYCHAYFETYGVPVTVVRYSNVYGPYQSPENPYCGVVSRFFERALRGQALQIHGDGEQTRDFTYVHDAVDATILACAMPQALGGTFNIGTGIEVSVNRLAEMVVRLVEEVSDVSAGLEYVDRRDIDNVRRRVVSIERARRVLRWSPRVTLSEGLRATLDWVRLNTVPVQRRGATGTAMSPSRDDTPPRPIEPGDHKSSVTSAVRRTYLRRDS